MYQSHCINAAQNLIFWRRGYNSSFCFLSATALEEARESGREGGREGGSDEGKKGEWEGGLEKGREGGGWSVWMSSQSRLKTTQRGSTD